MVVVKVFRRPGQEPDLAVKVLGLPVTPSPGAGPPVMLVHGMGSDHTTWSRVGMELQGAGRQVLAVDLRGHGRSGHAERYRLNDFRDDLAHLLDVLDIDEVDVVAHSLGAHSALRLAMRQPGRVRRLLLEEPPPMARDTADLEEGIAPSPSLGERARGFVALVKDPRPFLRFDRTMSEAVTVQFGQPDPQWWAGLGAVEAPVLVISGGHRSFLPARHLHRIAEELPRGEFSSLDAGHSVHRDRPGEFLAEVERHLLA